MNPPPESPAFRAAFRERLGMLLLGVAIGFVILGFIYLMRERAAEATRSSVPPPAQGSAPPR